MVSVDGVPTYVISLKDKSKINKAFVMINVENYTISASGETLEDALLQYREKIFGEEGLTPEDLTGETSEKVDAETKSTSGNIIVDRANINENSFIKTNSGNVVINNKNDIYVETETTSGDADVQNNNRMSEIVLDITTTSGNIKVN